LYLIGNDKNRRRRIKKLIEEQMKKKERADYTQPASWVVSCYDEPLLHYASIRGKVNPFIDGGVPEENEPSETNPFGD
jgi:hypothetical protein